MSRVFRLDAVLQNFQSNWLYIIWILHFVPTLWAAEGWIRRKITLKSKHFRFYFPRYVLEHNHHQGIPQTVYTVLNKMKVV